MKIQQKRQQSTFRRLLEIAEQPREYCIAYRESKGNQNHELSFNWILANILAQKSLFSQTIQQKVC